MSVPPAPASDARRALEAVDVDHPVLIAGAGPVGLAAALFLHERGIASRIVDKAEAPSTTSKAMAVNPRTLNLLEPTGVSAAMLAEGRPLAHFDLRRESRTVAQLDVRGVDPRFPMLVLPQARSEALLAEALRARGVEVERGVELTGLSQTADGVSAELRHADGHVEPAQVRLLYGADGAHSRVREAIGAHMRGDSFPEPWNLIDVRLKAPLDQPDGHVDFFPGGMAFAIAFDAARTTWRYVSSVGDPVDQLPAGAEIDEVTWRSSFHISHRTASKLAEGAVALGGDAAHLHSPVGARGMNLGVEDAAVFAVCAADALAGRPGRIADYHRLRHAVDHAVVLRVEAITRMARGRGVWALARAIVPALAARVPPLNHAIRKTAVGLDHPVRYA